MAKWPYSTANWQRLRAAKLSRDPMCEECVAEGRTGNATFATVVDHRHAISQGGAPFPELDGLASLCQSHHSRKTARGPEAGAFRSSGRGRGCSADGSPLDAAHPWNGGNGRWSREVIDRRMPSDLAKSAIPLTIVCGPPGSGKSTYIDQHAGAGDLVICMDTIMQRMSKLPVHQTPAYLLPKALECRNTMLRRLAKDTQHDAAWFIISSPSPRERELWASRLGGKLVVMDTPAIECVRRINADPTREGQRERMIEAVVRWWEANPHLVRHFPRHLINR